MVSVVLIVESDPRFWLSPYSTCESDGRSVVQEIVTLFAETEAVSTPEIKTSVERFASPRFVLVSGFVKLTWPEAMEAVVKVLSGLMLVLPISSAVRIR